MYLSLIDHPIPVIKSEQKLLLVPVVFIFLRVWDIIGDIIFIYYDHPESNHYIWLQILMVSVVRSCSYQFLVSSASLFTCA